MPRQQRYTHDQVADALRSSAGLRSKTAALLKCSPSTVKRYIDRSETLARIEREIVERNLDMAERGLLDAIEDGDLTAIMFYLKTKGRHRGYAERHQIEGRDGAPVEVKASLDFSGLSPNGVQFLHGVVQALLKSDGRRPATESGQPPSDPTQPVVEEQKI